MIQWIKRKLGLVKASTIEERITLGLVTEQEAAILPPHLKRLYDKWEAKRCNGK